MSDAHGQHPPTGRRSYRLAGSSDRSFLAVPTSMGHVDDLVAGYALGALDPQETAAVDGHVRHCPVCERALVEAQRTVGMLPFLAPMHAPAPDTKVALFARVAHVQRAAVASALPMIHGDAVRTPTLPSSAGIDLAAKAPAAFHAEGMGGSGRVSRSSWLVSALSVPLLIALVATGFWGLQLRDQLSTQDAQLVELQSEFANFASGTTAYQLSPGADAPMAEGQIVMGANQTDGMVRIDVNRKDGPRFYELIVNQGGNLEPAGEVTVDADGQGEGRIELDQPYEQYESVHIRAKVAGATEPEAQFDTLMHDSEGALGSTGSGLDVGP